MSFNSIKSRVVLFGLLLTLVCQGCNEPLPTAQHVDQNLVGSWIMKRDETLRKQKKVFREAGILKINQDVFDFQRNFEMMQFRMELSKDADFTCFMSGVGQSGNDYSGYWKTDGNKISIVQTHEDGKPKPDRMEGTYDENLLYLTHKQNDILVPFIFQRAEQN